VKGRWRQLHDEELRDLYSSPSIIRMIKSRRIRWERLVARMRKRKACKPLVGKPKGKRPLGRPRRRHMYSIKILERWDGVVWSGLVWLRIGTSGELL
jgi:hypothetical protein